MKKPREYVEGLECYKVSFTGAGKYHTEYIIGNRELVNDFVLNYENAYGVQAGEIKFSKIPKKLQYDESIIDLLEK